MLKRIIITSAMFWFITQPLLAVVETFEKVTIFYTESQKQGWTGIVRGRVLSLGTREIAGDELLQLAQKKTKVTCRISSPNGITKDDVLFIINEKNLIVSRVQVVTVAKSSSFGYLLVGYGNFKRVQKDFRLIQKKEQSKSRYAYIYKKRGDYLRNNDQIGDAIVQYEKAIGSDPDYPEAHLQLGYIYLKKGIPEYALKEFTKAFEYRDFIYDNEDRYTLYKGILEVRMYNAYESDMINRTNMIHNIDEAITVAIEAVSYYSDDFYLNFALGRLYFDNPEPDDIRAKDYLLKAIKAEPEHCESLVMLAELYYKHQNNEKALLYTRKALLSDPTNTRARDLLLKLEK